MGGKIVGAVIEETTSHVKLSYPGLLTFKVEAVNGGARFRTVASLQGWLPFTPTYTLYKAGIRGASFPQEKWLHNLWAQHRLAADHGAYYVNPNPGGVSIELDTGGSESPSVKVGTMYAEVGRVAVSETAQEAFDDAVSVMNSAEGADA